MTKNIIIFSALLRLRDMMLVHFPHIELHIYPHISEIWQKIWDINITKIRHIFVIFGPDETHSQFSFNIFLVFQCCIYIWAVCLHPKSMFTVFFFKWIYQFFAAFWTETVPISNESLSNFPLFLVSFLLPLVTSRYEMKDDFPVECVSTRHKIWVKRSTLARFFNEIQLSLKVSNFSQRSRIKSVLKMNWKWTKNGKEIDR